MSLKTVFQTAPSLNEPSNKTISILRKNENIATATKQTSVTITIEKLHHFLLLILSDYLIPQDLNVLDYSEEEQLLRCLTEINNSLNQIPSGIYKLYVPVKPSTIPMSSRNKQYNSNDSPRDKIVMVKINRI